MLLLCALIVGSGQLWATKITDVNNIVSGGRYYIGATVSSTDYYLSVGTTKGTVTGQKKSNKAEANVFVFTASNSKWTIKVDGTNYYITLPNSKSNGSVIIQDDAAEWTATTENELITLSINGFLLRANSANSLNFGSYQSGQTSLWLEPALSDNDLTITSSSPVALTITNEITNPTSTVTWTTSSTGALTWNTSNSSVATVANGVITAQGAGSANITVSQAATSTYAASETKTIVVNVTDSRKAACDLALTDAPIALEFDLYSNATPQVINYTTSSTGAVTVSASDYISTVVDEENKTITVTPLVETDAAQTITVSQAADSDYNGGSTTFTVSIDDSTPYVQPTSVTIDMNYTWLGSTNGGNLSKSSLPLEKNDENIITTITEGTSTQPRGDSDYIRVYTGSTITFAAPDGYVVTSLVFTTGGNNTWNAPTASSGTLSSKTWTGSAHSVKFTLTGNCFIASVAVTLAEAPAEPSTPTGDVDVAITLTTTANMAGWRTYNNNTGNKYTVDGTTKVYYASATGDNKVTLTEIDGGVPANTVVILHQSSGTTITLTKDDDATCVAPGSNELQVSTANQNLGKVYRLGFKAANGVGFYTYTSASAPAGVIYVSSVSSANFLGLDFSEGETTSVKQIETAKQNVGEVYDLQGRKVAQPTKGLYIVNGKKVIVK